MPTNKTKRLDFIFRIAFLLIYLSTMMVPTQTIIAAPASAAQESAIPEIELNQPVDSSAAPQEPRASKESRVAVSDVVTVENNSSEQKVNPSSKAFAPLRTTPAPASVYSFFDAGSDGNPDLTIEPITAYNLIVDSNVLSPSSYGPNSATMGAKYCNNTDADMTDVWAYIGTYDTGAPANSTPGVYPVHNASTDSSFNTDFPHLNPGGTLVAVDYGDPTRFFALEHESGTVSDTQDASRYLGTLTAHECRTVYWLVSYPRKAGYDTNADGVVDNWVDVTGDVKPDDDLWLQYYLWGKVGTNYSYYERSVTMRNEISAMANKIWPNTDSKVPDEYLTAIQQVLGWNTWIPGSTSTTIAYPGQTVTSQGIWYDFGNVGAGFDNNYDFVPDRNAWVQPIGDASTYDPGCFRLVKTYGLVVVKLNDGTELLIPFVDQMYFENIPDNNTGAVGLVYYEYVALNGACTAGLTPYQEVASGYDNEKFNADFGAGIPPLQSQETDITLVKTGPDTVAVNTVVDYSLTFTLPDSTHNSDPTMTISVGSPSMGMPLVFEDTIPAGMLFESASNAVTLTGHTPSSMTAKILYSTDKGITWSTTAPAVGTESTTANPITIQWWLPDEIKQNASGNVTGTVSFQAKTKTAATTPPATITNTGCLKLGNGPSFECGDKTTLVEGSYTLSGTVFKDDGVGGGVIADGVNAADPAEGGIGDGTDADTTGVTVKLYYDGNNDGDANDPEDILIKTTTTNISTGSPVAGQPTGYYTFTNLPAGSYVTVVDKYDADIPTYYALTTGEQRSATLSSTVTSVTGLDFGFAPPLSVDKTVYDNTLTVGETAQYTIAVSNILPGSGTGASGACSYMMWADKLAVAPPDTGTGAAAFFNPTNAFGSPDKKTADTNLGNSNNSLGLGGYNIGNMGGVPEHVYLVFSLYEKRDMDSVGTPPGQLDTISMIPYYGDAARTEYRYAGDGNVYVTYASTGSGTHPAVVDNNVFSSPLGTEYYVKQELDLQDIAGDARTSWDWSDFVGDNKLELGIVTNKAAGTGDVSIDAIGYLIETNQQCSGTYSTLNPVPLEDTFDSTKFSYVSSSPAGVQSGSTITWNNVGPIYPGQTKYITVTLKATTSGSAIPNSVTTNILGGPTYADGRPANNDTGTVNVDIAAAGANAITGTIFDDNNSNGWSGTLWSAGGTGIDALGTTDMGIQYIPVNLYACVDLATGNYVTDTQNKTCTALGGDWRMVASTSTNSSGYYSFSTLADAYYYVSVDYSKIAGSQVADVNQTVAGVCGTPGCDNKSADPLTVTTVNGSIIDLVDGGNITKSNVNFGYNVPTGTNLTLGDMVYYDWDGDGAQDSGEEGIDGVTVKLYYADGTLAATTTTVDGYYQFTGLSSAVYRVVVVPPTGTYPTADPDETALCVTCDNKSTVTLTASKDTVDFGYHPIGTGVIGDTVWKDLNGDGIKSGAQEVGIPNITVELLTNFNNDATWNVALTATTDASGKFQFSGLPDGTYQVRVKTDDSDLPKDGYGAYYVPTNGDIYTSITISGGVVTSMTNPASGITSTTADGFGDSAEGDALYLDADFGFAPLASIGDTVYWDVNKNGTQDTGETGISGVTVNLYTFIDELNGVWDAGETLTNDWNSDGNYDRAEYYIDANGNGVYDLGEYYTDADGSGTWTPADTFTDAPGHGGNGRYDPGEYFFTDTDGDGVWDATETKSLDPTTITATQTKVTSADNPATTDVDESGKYLFYGLDTTKDGVAYVVIVDTSTGGLSGKQQTGDPNMDGVVCPLSGQPLCDDSDGMVLYPGTSYLGADFGYLPSGSFGDTIWIDGNGNGIVDTGEKGIDGVDVRLYSYTDANGNEMYDAEPFTDTNKNGVWDTGEPYTDSNTNGSYDSETLGAQVGTTQTTDLNGNYFFTNVSDGNYALVVDTADLPSGLSNTYSPDSVNDRVTSVNISSGSVTRVGTCTASTGCTGEDNNDPLYLDADFGYQYIGSGALSGTICLEPTDDGICGAGTGASNVTSGVDTNEVAYADVTVYLYRWDDDGDGVLEGGETTQVASMQTTNGGDYSFANIPEGEYYIVAIGAPQSGLELTTTASDLPQVGDNANEAVVESNPTGTDLSAYQIVSVPGSGDMSVENVDFAFMLSGQYDFGDLPMSYSTTLSGTPDGARHQVPTTPVLYLGTVGATQASLIDTDGIPTTDASGDGADENGVVMYTDATYGAENADGWSDGVGVLQFDIVGSGWLVGWMDFDGDGQFSDANEMVVNKQVTSGQDQDILITVPTGTITGTTISGSSYVYARFRLFPSEPPIAALAYSGASTSGEVEDYRFPILGGVVTPVTLSYFRATQDGSTVKFDWATLTETGNLGFNLYVEDKNGDLLKINNELIPSNKIDSFTQQRYSYAFNVGGETFFIEDVSILGETQKHGPYQLGGGYGDISEEEKVDQTAINDEHKQKSEAHQEKLKENLRIPTAALRSPVLNKGNASFLLGTTLNLKVNKTGIYRITYEELAAAGLDLKNVPASKISMLNQGKVVPLYVQRPGSRFVSKFGPGAYIEFYGKALDTLYTGTNIYTLQINTAASPRISSAAAAPIRRVAPAAYFMDTLEVNNQRAYANYAPGNDPWYDISMGTATPKTFEVPFEIEGMVNANTQQTLKLVVWGATDFPDFDTDHHLQVSVNGVPIADEKFDGLVERTINVTLPAGVLRNGNNIFQFTVLNDTGTDFDVINLDKFSITYPHSFEAKDGQLTFTSAEKGFTVTNLPNKDVIVYRMDARGIFRLSQVKVLPENGGSYSASFAGTGKPATYIVTTSASLYAPNLEAARAVVNLKQPAQYLVITYPDFMDGLAPLIQARQAQGLTVSVVDVNDIYMQYSYGIIDPAAIQRYIAYAKQNLGTEYVLLVGGDTYDYRNYLGLNSVSFIPSLYATTGPTSRFVPVDPLYADVNNDNVPDLAIGRFPVRTRAELDLIVAKTLAYANKDYERTAVFASDKYDGVVSYKSLSLNIAATIPADWTTESIHMDDMTVSAAQQQLIAAMNRGTALITYTGHSAPTTWSFNRLFMPAQAKALTNTGRPFVAVQWGCFNTYYVEPVNNTLVQSLLFSGENGAAAIMGASTRTDSESEELLGVLLTPRLTSSKYPVGSAMLEAKKQLAIEHPELLDVLLGWTLMGDPALVIQP